MAYYIIASQNLHTQAPSQNRIQYGTQLQEELEAARQDRLYDIPGVSHRLLRQLSLLCLLSRLSQIGRNPGPTKEQKRVYDLGAASIIPVSQAGTYHV